MSEGACVPGNVPLTQPLVRESGEKGGGEAHLYWHSRIMFRSIMKKVLLLASATFNLAASLPSSTIPENNRLKLNSN